MYFTKILLNTVAIREINSTAIDFFLLKIARRKKHRISRHCSVELQTTKQTLTISKLPNSIHLQWLSLPFQMNRYKEALSNHRWKCKKGKGWRLLLVLAVTVTVDRYRKIQTVLRINQIAGFVIVPSWEKNIYTVPSKQKSEILFEVTSTYVWLKDDICSRRVRFANFRVCPEVVTSG